MLKSAEQSTIVYALPGLIQRSFDEFEPTTRSLRRSINTDSGQREANQRACAGDLFRSSGTGYFLSKRDQLEPDPDSIFRRRPPFVCAGRPVRFPARQSKCCRPRAGCPSTGSCGSLRFAVCALPKATDPASQPLW